MKRMRAALLGLVVVAAGCEGLYQRDITAVVTGPATLAVGQTVLLQCTLEYSDGTKSPLSPSLVGVVVWTSSNNEVATVDAFGGVTGVAPGTVTITATPAPFQTDGTRTPGSHTMTVQAAQ